MRFSIERLLAVASLIGIAACSDAPLIEYQGSASSEASADSATRLTITFWTQEDDSSFSGYVRSDGPSVGRGSAYAWHERSALRIATVSSRGDTVIWKSQSAGDSIGGRYEFVGGPQTGVFGTWRAHLTRGPAASPATRRAWRVTVVPAEVILSIIALLATLIAAARWIRRQPHPNATPVTGVLVGSNLQGIEGWLALFTLGQVIVIGSRLMGLPSTWNAVSGPVWDLGRIAWLVRPVLTFELAYQVGQIIFCTVGVFLIVKRSKFAPRYYLAFIACAAVFLAVDTVGSLVFTKQLQSHFGLDWSSSDESFNRELVSNLRAGVWSLVWAGYWINSLRVRTTFGCDALDRPLSIPRAERLVVTPSAPNNAV